MNKGVMAAVAGVLALVAVGAAVAMQGGGNAVAPIVGEAKQPNVIIILWDTVRADRMSVYGYELDTTPRIEKWANDNAVVYENAMSPAMWTVPSHASMFSGMPPSSHGAGFDHRWLDGANLTLAEHFAANGYDTYAFSANPNLNTQRVNLLQGFQHIDLSWGRKWKRMVTQHTRKKLIKRDRSTEISPSAKNRHKGTGYYNAGPVTHVALTQWLDQRQSDKPFFAYLSYMEAHKPRVPFLDSRRKVADDETIKVGLATDLSFNAQLLYSYDKKEYTPEQLEAVNRVYDATLIDLDNATADLLDDLAQRGILDDTIVILTADHGEQLGEHGQFGHRNGVYQSLVHVPLIIAYPRKFSPQRVKKAVSNLEIYSTLVDVAGLPAPDGPNQIVPGNLTDFRAPAKAVFAESISIDRLGFGKVKKRFDDLTRDVWANKYRTVAWEDYKLIETIDFDSEEVIKHELYHLAADPHEENDLSSSDPERTEALKARLHEWHDSVPKWDPSIADEPDNIEDRGKSKNADAMKKQLEMLGYVADDDEEVDDGAEGEGADDTDAPDDEGFGAP
jgi:arylsulfatase A-like enzyme